MWEAVKRHVLLPLLGRAGTVISVWLVAKGVEPTLASQVAVGLTACALIAFDFAVGYANRLALARKAAQTGSLSGLGGKP